MTPTTIAGQTVPNAGTGTYGTYTVNGTSVTNGTATAGQVWFETEEGGPWVLGRNVMLFTGLTSPTLDITAQERAGEGSRIRAERGLWGTAIALGAA